MLGDEGWWNHPTVIRSLLFAADSLSDSDELEPYSQHERDKDKGARTGKAWSRVEDSQLRANFEQHETVEVLANRHERSKGAIVARLVHLGLAKDRDEARNILASRSYGSQIRNHK
jgi:hypothetical protein